MQILLQILIILACVLSYKYCLFRYMRPLRFYYLLLIAKLIANVTTRSNVQLNWDIVWTLRLIDIVWISFIACHFCKLCKPIWKSSLILRSVPYAMIVICLLNLPFYKTVAQMRSFEIACLLFSLIVINIGCILSISEPYIDTALCFGVYIILLLTSFLIWAVVGYNPKTFLLAEFVGMSSLFLAASRYEVPSGN